MQITIELQPLKGIDKTRFGDVEVEHDVLTILGHVVTDEGHPLLVELGQVSKTPGRPVTFRRDVTGHQFPDAFKEAAIAAVEQYHRQRVVGISEQPAFGEGAQSPADEDPDLADPDLDDTDLEDAAD